MQKQQVIGLFVLLAVTAAVIGTAQFWTAEQAETAPPEREMTDTEMLANTPTAQIEGETVSPNGRFEIRAEGRSDLYVSGVVTPEALQIVDRETGEVKWEDQGWVTQSVLWSPVNNLVALAYGGRTWTAVKIISTAYWTSWEFTLPDGSPIPEYTFLPEEWGEWLNMDTLLLTVGRGGDAGEQHTYRCVIHADEDRTTGSAMEQTTEILPGSYDFDHDGEPETVELATVLTLEDTPAFPAWYELRIKKANGTVLWSAGAHRSHPGWTSVFACKVDGQDYLLQYEPEVWQGWAEYSYKLFYPYIVSPVTGERQEQILRESCLVWDNNFRMEGHHFDAAELADFLEEVHGYLDDSTLLLSTEGGELRIGGSGADFREDMDFWDEYCPYDERNSLEENLRSYEAFSKEIRGIT